MKIAAFVTVAGLLVSPVMAGQAARSPQPPATTPAKVAEAYEQFLIAHHLEERDDVAGAIAAYRKAIELHPLAADIPAELAALYLRNDRVDEAISTAEQALKVAPSNPEAHRVLGLISAAKVDLRPRQQGAPDANLAGAILHLEQAIANPVGEADPNARGTLARLYLRATTYEKAIPLLVDLVRQQPGWLEGPRLLAQAFAGAGRVSEAIDLLDQQAAEDPSLLPTLADFYERQRRWKDAANAYARALAVAPRNAELKTRYAQALLNAGSPDELTKAREALNDLTATRNDPRALYMLSQANRRSGDLAGAEDAARRLIAAQDASPWGYFALAEALSQGRQFARVVDALVPAIAKFRGMTGNHALELGMLLPHLGFALLELGENDKALASFDEAYRLAPKDPVVTGYFVSANIASKRYAVAAELAKKARVEHPADLNLPRLEAQALRHDGRGAEGVALLEQELAKHANEPTAYVALAQMYSEVSRGPQAVKLLQDAQSKFPASTAVVFELGATFEKQKDFAGAETAFRAVLAREPEHAGALNYLGYMLAEQGLRLDESVEYLKRALAIEPDNGSFLDSLGWAYFKAGKLDLAEENLRRAAEQLRANSVVQEHYGQLLFRLGRFDEAISAWNRALAGDGSTIDRADIDRKIRDARQKLNR